MKKLCWEIDDILLLEPFLAVPICQLRGLHDVAVGVCLSLQVSALQADHSVGQRVEAPLVDVLPYYLHQVGKLHHCTAHHKVKLSVLLLASQLLRVAVF